MFGRQHATDASGITDSIDRSPDPANGFQWKNS